MHLNEFTSHSLVAIEAVKALREHTCLESVLIRISASRAAGGERWRLPRQKILRANPQTDYPH